MVETELAARFDAYVRRKVGEIDAKYAEVLARGFATADFEGQPEPETLQCRNELDRTNWFGLLIKSLAARDEGFGDVPISPPIRCTSNRMYAVTYDDAIARMFALLDVVGAAQANWWRLKDEARAVEKRTDLDLIDLSAGWP